MTYQQAIQYLNTFFNLEHLTHFNYRKELNLARMRCLLAWFRFPEKRFKSILIAGTKGKGSTASFLSSILWAHGYRVGLYTSPHLSDLRERFCLNGRVISKEVFREMVHQIKRVIIQHRFQMKKLAPITFFEVTTLLAFLYFEREQVDFAVLEVGLGGRLDATNVVHQTLSLLTPIGIDHVEYLGRTLPRIAYEKAGILKSKSVFVSAAQPEGALQTIKRQAGKLQAHGTFSGQHYSHSLRKLTHEGASFDFKMGEIRYRQLEIKLTGAYQAENASTALAGVLQLARICHLKLQESKIRKGLKGTRWPGRFEVLKRGTLTYILDGAHNVQSLRVLTQNVRRLFPRKSVVAMLGLSREKDVKSVLSTVKKLTRKLVVTQTNHPRAESARRLVELAQPHFETILPTTNTREGLANVAKLSGRNDLVLVTGSLFLVGETRKILQA